MISYDLLSNAEKIVYDFVEGETYPCWYDHHGYCQEHGWFDTDPICPVRRGRDLLGLDDA